MFLLDAAAPGLGRVVSSLTGMQAAVCLAGIAAAATVIALVLIRRKRKKKNKSETDNEP